MRIKLLKKGNILQEDSIWNFFQVLFKEDNVSKRTTTFG
jgi:hypothetical protein